jgi:hypothetical protein
MGQAAPWPRAHPATKRAGRARHAGLVAMGRDWLLLAVMSRDWPRGFMHAGPATVTAKPGPHHPRHWRSRVATRVATQIRHANSPRKFAPVLRRFYRAPQLRRVCPSLRAPREIVPAKVRLALWHFNYT